MQLPKIAQKGPFKVNVEAGKTYFWCSCGLSQSQPFCDSSHKGSGFKSKSFIAERTETLFLCGCKATKASPRCDGTHLSLSEERIDKTPHDNDNN